MAAPPSKPSPSNQSVQKTNETVDKAAPKAVTENPMGLKLETTSSMKMKKCSIQAYEDSENSELYKLAKHFLAQGEFETAITSIEKGIESVKDSQDDENSAMAPFHYLYGTTLLYSIEESTDTSMTVENAQDSPADDMQIAWENLEAARILVENLLKKTLTEQKKMKLQLDLAQISLREADLQRMNGRYSDAIQDYNTCLKFRKIHLGQFDRKIADAQYNLGLSYLSHSAEILKQENSEACNQTMTVDRKNMAREHCQKGIQLYIDCAQTFCGQIALACGVEPLEVLQTNNEKQAGFKTTGLDEDQLSSSEYAQNLRTWRKAVANLYPSAAGDLTDVNDLRQLLDEIQETVDEAEQSQDAVRQASQLNVQAQKAAQADGHVEVGPDGATTTIGFGNPTLSAAQAMPQPVSASTAQQAKPMMVIKKKKKKREDDDSKPAATASKRPKTE